MVRRLVGRSLARFRRIERPSYGYFVDHSCDGLTILFIMVGMGTSPYVTMSIALFALAGYLLLAIHTFLIAHVIHEFPLSYFNIGPTELRIILIILSLSMLLTEYRQSSRGSDIF
jgi:phosphatidylglycerophosphate synthase